MEWARSSSCPDEEVLLAFTEGRLDGGPRTAVVDHLDVCSDCLTAVNAAMGGAGQDEAPPARVQSRAGSVSRSSPGSPRQRTAFGPGDLVAGRYEIQRFVARGGMGEVYRAADRLLGIDVALKTVLLTAADDPRAVELLRREVRVARAITHPGVCRVYDLGEHVFDAGTDHESALLFLTMEFLDGVTLGQRVRSRGVLAPALVLQVARQLAAGLQAAHAAGIVHRDLKSDNVMWLGSPDDGLGRVVIMDFGLARVGPGGGGLNTTGGLVVGSVGYMAPEQVEGGKVGPAADIYAFGVVLFEIATGALPFAAATPMATALKRLREDPPAPRALVPDLPASLEAVILRCLARKPAERFATMAEVLGALSSASPAATVRLPLPPRRRGLVAGLGLAAAAVGVWAVFGRGDGPAVAPARVLVAPAPERPPAVPDRSAETSPPVVAPPPAPPPAAVAPPANPTGVRARKPPVRTAPAVPAPELAPKTAAPRRSQSELDGFPDPFAR